MRRSIFTFTLTLMLAIFSTSLLAQETARLQVIHNAADPAASTVDVYLDGGKLLDDFSFRSATAYIDAPANRPIRIDVAPATSTSAADSIRSFYFNLAAGQTYVAIANGVVDPSGFSANPDARDINFNLFAKGDMRETGTSAENVDFVVFHGATDAPAVDVIARDVAKIVDGAAYSDFTDYISVPAASYLLDVTPAMNNETIVGTFKADLSGLGGGAAVVFASGFLAPAANQDGPAFGLYAALPNGTVVEFPAQTTARLQVIHNAADPAAKMVDIYLNDTKLLDDFEFRSATPYIDAPANQDIVIGVAPATSASVMDTITSFTVNLKAVESYVAIANGVLDPSAFSANPDGKDTGFTLFIKSMTRESGMTADQVDFVVLHGATDAPAVDVIARDVATLVDDAPYSAITDYISVPAASYLLDVTPAMDNETIVGTFKADLSGLGGGAAVVFASGFLAPAANQNGPAFGLYAALPNGTVVEFPAQTTARLQVIHNAADPAAKMVDIYLNDTKLLDDFEFRAATPYIDAPANQDIVIGVAPATSASVMDTITSFTVNLKAVESYVAIANGVLDPSAFSANPDGKDTGFTLFIKSMTRESGMTADQVDFVVLHGATDAPAVDVIARDVATLVDDAPYSAITDYISVPAASYLLDVTPAMDNETIVGTFKADLSGLGGGAAVVFASGFLAPAANQDGPAFGLYAALPNGTVVEFPAQTTARLQVIHNAADPAAKMVDIYLNDTKLLDDFEFRAATPYIDAPANQDIVIGVAPATSASVMDTITSFTVNLKAAETYAVVANGVLDPSAFAPNPDQLSTAFNLFVKPKSREAAMDTSMVEFTVFHGATDAPAVDVKARRVAELVNGLMYGQFSDYIAVPADGYVIDLSPKGQEGTIVATFDGNISSLKGGAAIVFASGFLMPAANQDGPAFGLYAALPDGQVVNFATITTARIQIIHNAADPAAKMVDIYINNDKALDDFTFRSATPFIDIPANQQITIGVAPANSTTADESIKTFNVNFMAAETYVAIANGVVSPAGFRANPDGRSTAFNLIVKDQIRENGNSADQVDFIVLHGSTDAPTVDIIARDVATLVDNAAYGDIADYISVPAASYTLDITPGEDNNTIVASFASDLSTLGGGSAVVFASGFLTPDAENQNGEAFGVYAALADGQVVAFSSVTAITSEPDIAVNDFELQQNYPNPFNPTTTISFAMPVSRTVSLKVFNVAGQQVAELMNGTLNAGRHSFTFDAANLTSGIYFYVLKAGAFSEVRRMTLLK